MAEVSCKFDGPWADPNMYEGKEVVVIYYSDYLGIVVEEGVVENGVVQLKGAGPATDQRYYVGLKYDSIMKTFPLRNEGKLNNKARLSEISLFMADALGEGIVEVGGPGREPVSKVIEYDREFKEGRFKVNIGTPYEEEPYIKVTATGLNDFKMLALDADYRQYER